MVGAHNSWVDIPRAAAQVRYTHEAKIQGTDMARLKIRTYDRKAWVCFTHAFDKANVFQYGVKAIEDVQRFFPHIGESLCVGLANVFHVYQGPMEKV